MSERTVEMRSVLRALSAELAALGQLAEALEPVLAAAYVANGKPQAQSVAVQSSDLLTQTLRELASFTHSIASDLPRSWRFDVRSAVRDVPLADLAAALTGGRGRGEEVACGELELF